MSSFPQAGTSPIVAPSVLAADFGQLAAESSRAIRAGADWLHLDVMDGHFVPNISFGPAVVEAISETNDIFLDVHLMIKQPERYLERFAEAGADLLTVHVEEQAQHQVGETLQAIADLGCRVGLALNPATPFEVARPYLEQVDLLLMMTVVPGFGGQSFMPEVLPKIQEASRYRAERGMSWLIEVDGGIGVETSAACQKAGAEVLVAGSSTFGTPEMGAAISAIRGA